jgi:hypothetical protein
MMKNETWEKKSKRNSLNVLMWSALWVVSMAITGFAPRYVWDYNTTLSIISVAVHLLVGLGMILANRRHLLGLDKLQQKIQYSAMALCLGVGLVAGLSYELLEDIKLITFQPEIPHLVILMCLTYMVGIIMGKKRYM